MKELIRIGYVDEDGVPTKRAEGVRIYNLC
jgi:hypothetical protein